LELSLGDAPFAAQEAGYLAERWLDGLIRYKEGGCQGWPFAGHMIIC
jgi:hypothetical protein